MKAALYLTLPLLAGLAAGQQPVPALPETPVQVTPEQAAQPPGIPLAERNLAGRMPDEATRRHYHNALNGLLVCIHDRATADAAAPRVAALLASPEGQGLRAANFTLVTCYSYNFWDSAALKEALQPVLHEPHDGEARVAALLAEATGHLDAVTAALAQVKDAESERQAVDCLHHHLPDAGNAIARANSTASRCPGACAFTAYGQPMLALDRLLHAYGHAKARMAGNCASLVAAMDAALRAHMEQTTFYDPHEVTPESVQRHEARAAALHEWFAIASSIVDQATADAAATWLQGKNTALGEKLNTSPGCSIIAESPCITLLEAAESNIYLYLANAEQPFFGSVKLADLYAPEPEDEPEESPAP